MDKLNPMAKKFIIHWGELGTRWASTAPWPKPTRSSTSPQTP